VKSSIRVFRSLAAVSGFLVQSAFAANPPVRVAVSASQSRDSITYCYQVSNDSTAEINNFVIGSRFDPSKGDSFPELGKLPKGWRKGSQGDAGTSIILGPSSSTQPTGWVASAHGQEDTAFFYLAWQTPGGVRAIQPGQTLSGFCVTVQKGRDPNLGRMPPGSDLKYLTGHFGVSLPSGEIVDRAVKTISPSSF